MNKLIEILSQIDGQKLFLWTWVGLNGGAAVIIIYKAFTL
jgi:hypothetical protein